MFETVPSGTGLAVLNPATEQQIAEVREFAPAEIAALIDAADAARPAWAAETAKARAAVLLRTNRTSIVKATALAWDPARHQTRGFASNDQRHNNAARATDEMPRVSRKLASSPLAYFACVEPTLLPRSMSSVMPLEMSVFAAYLVSMM